VNPIRLAWTKLVHRVQDGLIESVWAPTEAERRVIAEGGAIVLALHMEPIPPISMRVIKAEDAVPVAEHGFKVPEELAERAEEA
jgi:hypothetical protein